MTIWKFCSSFRLFDQLFDRFQLLFIFLKLYDFLESLIILIDTEGFMLGIVKELKITSSSKGFSLMATLLGDNADSYDVHTYIKAVTYSDMFIKEEKNLVTVQVVHDI